MITHPEKVLFPDTGVTKSDVAAYYEAVAAVMIPHLRGRPITMERFPAGIGNDGFLQKNVSKGFPAWLKRVEVPKKGSVDHVERPGLTRIRQHIVELPDEWRRAKAGLEIQGEQLKRGPAGFPAAHEHIEDLKRQQLYTLTELSEAEVVAESLIARFTEACVGAAPVVEFQTKALGLRWQ